MDLYSIGIDFFSISHRGCLVLEERPTITIRGLGSIGPSAGKIIVQPTSKTSERGFSTVDALVGLMILSSCLALSLSAQASARRVADLARETRAASTLLQLVSNRDLSAAQSNSGVSGQLAWQVSLNPAESAGPISLCSARADIRRPGTQRVWRRETLRPCPVS